MLYINTLDRDGTLCYYQLTLVSSIPRLHFRDIKFAFESCYDASYIPYRYFHFKLEHFFTKNPPPSTFLFYAIYVRLLMYGKKKSC